MSEKSKIEWCDYTLNYWIGCSKVSRGCMNCYAERDWDHRFGKAVWGPRGTRVRTSERNRNRPYAWNKKAQENGQVQTVFTASLADVFEDYRNESVPQFTMDAWRAELFAKMEATPWLVWLVLTKRPENVSHMVPSDWLGGSTPYKGWPSNVWLGFSAEDQSNFDYRIESALAIPTPVLWVSAEPLLGKINMTDYLDSGEISWVIAGGESGPKARPMHSDWACTLQYQCEIYDVPFFFKQWGEWVNIDELPDGVVYENAAVHYWPDLTPSWRVGRKKAPKTLKGIQYLEFPHYLEEYEEKLLDG